MQDANASSPEALESSPSSIVLWLDKADRIQKVSDSWNQFAKENGGNACLGESVIGQPIWRFITGDSTWMLVHTLMLRARVIRAPVRHHYRCDSPDLRRHMEMIIYPEADGGVRIEHRLLSAEPIAPPVRIDPATHGQAVPRCSMCNRIKLKGQWKEAPDALAAGEIAAVQKVFYGICRDCWDRVWRLRL